MELIQSVILGIIQGLTEFLPVSSSAHLVVVPSFLGAGSRLLNSLSFDVALHAGTLLAVTFYYRRELYALIAGTVRAGIDRKLNGDFILAMKIALATLPAVIAGVFFQDAVESVFRNPLSVAGMLLIFGIALYAADKAGAKTKEMAEITFGYALVIGLAQALAIMPGVSRSGVTITAALLLGIARKDSADFSFLISFPVILGAFVFKIHDIAGISGRDAAIMWAGLAASAVSGYIAIMFLVNFVKKHSYMPFAVYRGLLALAIAVYFLAIK